MISWLPGYFVEQGLAVTIDISEDGVAVVVWKPEKAGCDSELIKTDGQSIDGVLTDALLQYLNSL